MNAPLIRSIGVQVFEPDKNVPPPQNATAGPLMLALTHQLQADAFAAGVLWARLVRRGYRERADRALEKGNLEGITETHVISADKPRRLF